MKILHVIASANPASGGVTSFVVQLSLKLIEQGHECEVLSLDDPQVSSWINVFPLKVYALGPGVTPYLYCPRTLGWLKENSSRYDLVVVNGIWLYHSFAVWKALYHSKTPYIVYPHGMLDPYFKKAFPLKHLKKWCFWPWADYRVIRDARATVFMCEEEKILARESFWLYKAKEQVVNFGIADIQGDAETQKASFFDRWPELKNKRILLFLSRIHPKKGCDLLIEAFAKIAQSDFTLHLVIAGPDQTNWRHDLELLATKLGISNRITWTGMITGDIKYGAFRSAEAFVLPSHQENFGIAVVESLACGIPVLISNKVNIWREIERENAGIVGNDTIDSIAEVFSEWIGLTDKERDILAKNAFRCFHENFDITTAVNSFLKIARDLIIA